MPGNRRRACLPSLRPRSRLRTSTLCGNRRSRASGRMPYIGCRTSARPAYLRSEESRRRTCKCCCIAIGASSVRRAGGAIRSWIGARRTCPLVGASAQRSLGVRYPTGCKAGGCRGRGQLCRGCSISSIASCTNSTMPWRERPAVVDQWCAAIIWKMLARYAQQLAVRVREVLEGNAERLAQRYGNRCWSWPRAGDPNRGADT